MNGLKKKPAWVTKAARMTLLGCLFLEGCSQRESPPQPGGAASVPRGEASSDRPRAAPTKSPDRDATSHVLGRRGTKPPRPGQIHFTDATTESQITFRFTDGASGRRYIVETVVAGLATFDYDGDGLIDIYFLNGAPLPGAETNEVPRDALYRNNGDWTFTDVTEAAGIGDSGYGMGVAAGDFDNDGDQDLYVNNFGPNAFYINNGDGTFHEASHSAGVACDKLGAGVVFLDMESDGDLDLYVANYVDFAFDRHKTRFIGKYEFSLGPRDYPPQSDVLFRNEEDGTFRDVSQSSGIAASPSPSMGAIAGDFDDDRDPDLFVCADAAPNLLWRNDGAGRFTEEGLLAGVAHDLSGADNGSMGVDCGDYDNDGRLDLFVTNYQGELAVLYRNLGGGLFADVTRATGVGASSFPHVKWGTTLADFDNDGDRDIFIACGHFMDNIRYIDDRTDVRVPNFLLANQGNGRFVDVSQSSGDGLAIVECSKGAAFDDLDNDGDLDAVVLNIKALPSVLRNDTSPAGHSLSVHLRGRIANRDGVGARVKVIAGELTQIAEVHAGRGYQSHYGTRLHFGLGAHDQVDRIEVRWSGSDEQIIENPPDSRELTIVEGVTLPHAPAR
jgi:hypothetical protein